MVVQAYILIQTEVGKAAAVAREIAEHQGRHPGRGRHRPVRRDRPRRGQERRRARQAGRREGAGRRRHHPDADLPGRPPLSRSRRRLAPARRGRRRRPPCSPALRSSRVADPSPVRRCPTPPCAGPRPRPCAAPAPALPDEVDGPTPRHTDAARRPAPPPGATRPSCCAAASAARPGSAPTAQVIEVDGVELVASTELAPAYVFTTVGRGTYVRCGCPGRCPRSEATAPLVDLGRTPWRRPRCRPADRGRGSAQAGGAAQRGLHQPVDQRRVVEPGWPPTSAGTSTPA